MTEEHIKQIEEYKRLMDGGLRVNGGHVTELYNEVFGTRLASTNCSTCIKRRISLLYNELENERRKKDKEEQQDS